MPPNHSGGKELGNNMDETRGRDTEMEISYADLMAMIRDYLGRLEETSKRQWEIVRLLNALAGEVVGALRRCPREGTEVDNPEGSRYIQLSDTAANAICDKIESALIGETV